MADTALIVANNLSHNVVAHIEAAKNSLSHLATVYLVTEVAGQSAATVDAKYRDLQRFLTFYQTLYKHDRPEEWFVSVTKAFLKARQQERLAQALRPGNRAELVDQARGGCRALEVLREQDDPGKASTLDPPGDEDLSPEPLGRIPKEMPPEESAKLGLDTTLAVMKKAEVI